MPRTAEAAEVKQSKRSFRPATKHDRSHPLLSLNVTHAKLRALWTRRLVRAFRSRCPFIDSAKHRVMWPAQKTEAL